ncbi:MAG: arsenic resistance N-acetyltransferase ArsN2 [Candidatus Limnocylindrales bacterium]|jgi:amino-acid N-acetyltransferase
MTAIEPARPTDRPAIEGILRANDLPTAGLELALGTAVVAREDGQIVGCAAVEIYGRVGLLRSVCVAPPFRSLGLGARLVEEAETLAAARDVAELFLLTETAADWFARRGYEPDARESAPGPLQASPEFTGGCPVSATLLRKRLNREAPAT